MPEAFEAVPSPIKRRIGDNSIKKIIADIEKEKK